MNSLYFVQKSYNLIRRLLIADTVFPIRVYHVQKSNESCDQKNRKDLEKLKSKYPHVSQEEQRLTNLNAKTVEEDRFYEWCRVKLDVNRKCGNFYRMLCHRKRLLRGKLYARKSMTKFLNKIAKTFGPDAIIGKVYFVFPLTYQLVTFVV